MCIWRGGGVLALMNGGETQGEGKGMHRAGVEMYGGLHTVYRYQPAGRGEWEFVDFPSEEVEASTDPH